MSRDDPFNQIFKILGGGMPSQGQFQSRSPFQMNVYDEEIVVHGDLTGFKEDEITVTLSNKETEDGEEGEETQVIEITAENKQEVDQHVVRAGMSVNHDFSKELPYEVEPEGLDAQFNNGVLTVVMPLVTPLPEQSDGSEGDDEEGGDGLNINVE